MSKCRPGYPCLLNRSTQHRREARRPSRSITRAKSHARLAAMLSTANRAVRSTCRATAGHSSTPTDFPVSIARATDRAEGSGQDVNAKPSRAIPVSRPSAWPGSDNSPPKISRPNSTGLRSRIRPVGRLQRQQHVAAASTAAVVVTHLMASYLPAIFPTSAESR